MALQLFKIADLLVESPASSVTFSSIPQGYTDLMLFVSFRSSTEDIANNTWLTFNGVGGTAYTTRQIYTSNGTSAVSGAEVGTARSSQIFTSSSASPAQTFGNMLIHVPNYSSSKIKSWSADWACENTAASCHLGLAAGQFNSTAAITSINLQPYCCAWLANSTATLYGIL